MNSVEKKTTEFVADWVIKLWPLWALLATGALGYLHQQSDVVTIKAQMASNKAERDKQLAERDVKLAEREKREQSEHDKLVETRTILDCMRFKNCN